MLHYEGHLLFVAVTFLEKKSWIMKKVLLERYLNTNIVCDIVLAVGVVPEVVAVLKIFVRKWWTPLKFGK